LLSVILNTLLSINSVGNFYRFIDGAAAICLRGADGKKYITLINTEGEFLMEPIMCDGRSAGFDAPKLEAYGTYSDGMIFAHGIDACFVLCANGEVYETAATFAGMDTNAIKFNCGYCWDTQSCHLVNVMGESLLTLFKE